MGLPNEQIRSTRLQFDLCLLFFSIVVLSYLIADCNFAIQLLTIDATALWERHGDTPAYWDTVFRWHNTGKSWCFLSPFIALVEWTGAFVLSLFLNRKRRLFLVSSAVIVGLVFAAKVILLAPFVLATP